MGRRRGERADVRRGDGGRGRSERMRTAEGGVGDGTIGGERNVGRGGTTDKAESVPLVFKDC